MLEYKCDQHRIKHHHKYSERRLEPPHMQHSQGSQWLKPEQMGDSGLPEPPNYSYVVKSLSN